MADIFLSHEKSDSEKAFLIAKALGTYGYSSWLYERDALPAISHFVQTGKNIENCKVFILICSKAAALSEQVWREVEIACDAGKPICPLLLRISHEDFLKIKKDFRYALGAKVAIPFPTADIAPMIESILKFFKQLEIYPEQERVRTTKNQLEISERAAVAQVSGNFEKAISLWRDNSERCINRQDTKGYLNSKLHEVEALRSINRTDEALAILDDIDNSLKTVNNTEHILYALVLRAEIYVKKNELRKAIDAYKAAEQLCRKENNLIGQISCLNFQADILKTLDEGDNALKVYINLENLARKIPDDTVILNSLNNRFDILFKNGDFKSANILLKQIEEFCKKLGDNDCLVNCFGNQAKIKFFQGKHSQAMAILIEQEKLCEVTGNNNQLAECIGFQAKIQNGLGKINEAIALYKKQQEICYRIEDKSGLLAEMELQLRSALMRLENKNILKEANTQTDIKELDDEDLIENKGMDSFGPGSDIFFNNFKGIIIISVIMSIAIGLLVLYRNAEKKINYYLYLKDYASLIQKEKNLSTPIATLKGHIYGVWSVACSPDGRTMASGSFDKSIKIWSTDTWEEIGALTGHLDDVRAVTFSPDGLILASGSRKIIKLRSTNDMEEICTIKLSGDADWVNSLSFSPNGELLASASMDKNVKIWSVKDWSELKNLSGHTDWVRTVAFSNDGKMLASGSYDKTIKLWSVPDGKLLNTLSGHNNNVLSVAFNHTDSILVSGGADNCIKFWLLPNGREIKSLNDYSTEIRQVNYSPDGSHLIYCVGNSVLFWSVKKDTIVRSIGNHSDIVSSFCITHDGTKIVTGSWDNTIAVWPLI